LHVTVRWTIGTTKRYVRAVRATGPNEPDLLTRVASGCDLEATGQELQRAIRRTPEPDGCAVNRLAHLLIDRERGIVTGRSRQRRHRAVARSNRRRGRGVPTFAIRR
jgi:hypothetical protein